MIPDSINVILRASTWRRALVLAVIFLALYAVRWVRPHTVSAATQRTIHFLLYHEYLNRLQADRHGPPSRETMQADAQLDRDIHLDRITAKGLLWANCARVEVSVAGGPPPGGRTVRYFRIDPLGYAESQYDGWRYYCALW